MADEVASLVVVDEHDFRWAVYASDVLAIADCAGWSGEPPIDVGRVWRAAIRGAAAPPAKSATRLLVVDDGSGSRALFAASVSFRTVPRSTILSLPAVLGISGVSFVEGVVFYESENPVIVLNVDRIDGDERK